MSERPKFLADEDFDHDIVRGVLRRAPDIDIVSVKDVGLSGAHDAEVLAWAAKEHRLLLTHDVTTMKTHAFVRVTEGLPLPGVFAINQTTAVSEVIEAILLLAECSLENEWEGQIRYLPF